VSPTPDQPAGYYGSEPEIAHFYAGSGVLTRGEHAVVCYGTRNVRNVRLDPPVEALSPALNRCFAVSPKDTTTYTLYAEAADGRLLSQSFQIVVNPAPPFFSMLATSGKQVTRGDRWAFCYSVDNAVSVVLEPTMQRLPTGNKRCLMFFPSTSMEYRLVAVGERGMKAIERMSVKVLPK
jgi:hypothetical protein